jgi:hypothetical protein
MVEIIRIWDRIADLVIKSILSGRTRLATRLKFGIS